MPGTDRNRSSVPVSPAGLRLPAAGWVATSLVLASMGCGDGDGPGAVDVDPVDSHRSSIVGGDEAELCAWSGAVLLLDEAGDSLCSGVLLHPRVVAYAGHCGTGFTEARFGNGMIRRAVPIARDGEGALRCYAHPDCDGACDPEGGRAGDPWDYAVCVLSSAYRDAAVVPPAMGCELDAVRVPDLPAQVVGFGRDDLGMSGMKNVLEMRVDRANDDRNELVLAPTSTGTGACVGDSGGPAYVELDDGSWRVAGVLHAVDAPCGRAFERVLAPAVPWIEEVTGFDVSPCHDADGTWRPSAACQRFPTDPGGDHGDYPDCVPGRRMTALPSTCGPAFGSEPPGEDAGPGAPPDAGGLDGGPSAATGDGGLFVPDVVAGGPDAGLTGGCQVGRSVRLPGAAVAGLVAAAFLRRRRRRKPGSNFRAGY